MNELPVTEPERQLFFIEKLKNLYTKREEAAGRKLTYNIQTFGCQMNAKDSEKLAGILEKVGFIPSETEEADFVIYNTCTVRENANTRVYGRIGRLGNLKKKNPFMTIALCGCMMQESENIDKIKKSYSFVDIVFGTHNIFKLAELIYERWTAESKKPLVDILNDATVIVEDLPSARKFSFKAGVNIMYGCDNFCSYCIVPYVRGRERSRKPEDIISEITKMVSEGVVEVMLLGQNVNSYGKGLADPCGFPELLRRICRIEGLQRIRFMTPHPKDLSDELIEVIKNEPKICRHIHLPMQSGSTKILKSMNRKYTKEDYLSLVDRIRKELPDVSLTTDIIVGFPGETEEDFLETCEVVSHAEFDSAFTFIYSKRTGTVASKMTDTVPEEMIKNRFDRLLCICREISERNTEKLLGMTVNVLAEEPDGNESGMLTGRLSNNLLVHFRASEEFLGKFVNVKLTECKGFYFIGQMK